MTLLDLMDMDAPVRRTLNAQLAAFFKAHRGEWVDGRRLEFAGRYAWRTRLSNLRRAPFNLTIENRQRKVDGYTVSEYRLVP